MKTSEANRTKRGRAVIMVAALLAAGMMGSGCAMLDSIDRRLAEWGVVDQSVGVGVDALALVDVTCGSSRGVGVVVDGGLIFTANHVVKGGETAVVRTFGLYDNAYHQTVEARVVYRNPLTDQALLSPVEPVELPHRMKLGKPEAGPAEVLPLRASGRTVFGDELAKPVSKPGEVIDGGRRYRCAGRISYGDSGAPIVQDGKVVGLVRGESKMVPADVLERYSRTYKPVGREIRTVEAGVACSRPSIDKKS